MNKSYYFLLLFLFSCVQEIKKEQSTENIIVEYLAEVVEQKDTIIGVLEKIDSTEVYVIGNKSLMLIPNTLIGLHMEVSKWETIEEEPFLLLDSLVDRVGDSLLFKTKNGNVVILESISFEEADNPIRESILYSFGGSIDKTSYWNVGVICYECHYTILINKINGEQIITLGTPFVSPSGKYILFSNEDIETGYTKNGFELFEQVDNEIFSVGELEINGWGPNNVSWRSDSLFWIVQSYFEDNYDRLYKYGEVVIQ